MQWKVYCEAFCFVEGRTSVMLVVWDWEEEGYAMVETMGEDIFKALCLQKGLMDSSLSF